MRIAVCGFEHETNTFAPIKADYQAFLVQKNYPRLLRGPELLEQLPGTNLPSAGAIEYLRTAGAEIVPLLWCLATPSAHVTEDAYERIAAEILERLAGAGRIDGLFLELHGAMVAEHTDDGEGELLARIRQQVGRELPIAVPLDLHANVSPEMVAHADVLDAYRRYPHIDCAETGARTARHLVQMIRTGIRPRKAFRQIEFLIPINGGCTDFGPARDVYLDIMPGIERETEGLMTLSFASGFPLADIRDVGPSVVAYAETQAAADHAADKLMEAVRAREAAFLPDFLPAKAAVERALEIAAHASKPVVIADTQDNPGGGGPGDTTGLLRALIAARAEGAAIGAIIDPETAAAAHHLGIGQTGEFAIGGKRMPDDEPVRATCRVLAAADGSWKASGPMKAGMTLNLGQVALLETLEGVRIAVASRPAQTLDRSIFAYLGLDPEKLPIIAVKSSVHFRADFTPLAEKILVAVAPGPVAIDHASLVFTKLRPGVRLMPTAA